MLITFVLRNRIPLCCVFAPRNDLQVVPTARSHLQRWAEVVNRSDRSVTLIDLCGHEKYLKTTVFGLTGKTLRVVLTFF